MKYEDNEKNVKIVAKEINIGHSVVFGQDVSISVKGEFRIGDHSRLGNDTQILGNNIIFGEHLFNSSGLRVGGGGRQNPTANLHIGDRCTIHNNFIIVCEPVVIGNVVGLSPDVNLITHGYWLSVLEGFPAKFEGINIGNGVIVGTKSSILMGVEIADCVVVGAGSVVTKSLTSQKSIYAGNPAKFIRAITPPSLVARMEMMGTIIEKYSEIAEYHDIDPKVWLDYPFVHVNEFIINVETFEHDGIEDDETDDFRDYIRKWGIRIYTNRGFKSNFSFE
ncbi:MAG TPA: acyltransferase [archaeon]|nr:acyltransferase [archaeon]